MTTPTSLMLTTPTSLMLYDNVKQDAPHRTREKWATLEQSLPSMTPYLDEKWEHFPEGEIRNNFCAGSALYRVVHDSSNNEVRQNSDQKSAEEEIIFKYKFYIMYVYTTPHWSAMMEACVHLYVC